MARLKKKVGTEGPWHDPYHYDEFRFTATNGDTHVFHVGALTSYYQPASGKRWAPVDANALEEVAIEKTGLSFQQMERICERLHGVPKRCRYCGSRKFRSFEGFVGESMIGCRACGQILWEEDATPYII